MSLLLLMMMGACRIAEVNLWADWDETSEAGLASDDIFVCMMENINAGGDETGQGGGLAGANLVLTEAGGLAGATGTPPTRVADGIDDSLAFTTVALDALMMQNSAFTVIIKVTDLAIVSNDRFLYFRSAGGTEQISIHQSSTKLAVQVKEAGTDESEITTDAFLVSTEYWIALWSDGTVLRAGFATSKPTKWSDFAANKRVQWTNNPGTFTGDTWSTRRSLLTTGGGANFVAGDFSYFIIAKTCLIDNNS